MESLFLDGLEKRFESLLLHEDDSLLCINKPAGLLSQPDASGLRSVNDVARQWLARNRGGCTVFPVHRLDRRATGCLLLARSHVIASKLSAAFAAMQVTKHYLAVTSPNCDAAAGIRLGEARRLVHSDCSAGRLLEWRALAVSAGCVLLAISTLGGSKHQVP